MANKFTLTSGSYQGRYMELSCEQTVNIATNKSTISWTLSVLAGEANHYSTGPTTVTINGVQVYYCSRKAWNTYEFPAAKGSVSGTIDVDHNGDGSRSINVSLSTAIWHSSVKGYSGTWELESIPRGASILSAPDFNDTQLPTVTYSNPAGEIVEALDICIADATGYTAYVPYRPINRTGSLSYQFTSEDITTLKNITGNSLAMTFLIRTKIGGEYFYSQENRTFTVTENSDTKPVVSMTVSLNNDSLPSKFDGMYIQGKSRVKVILDAICKYNATLEGFSAVVDGKTYNSPLFVSDVIQSAGNVDIVGYAKDSRGFTGSASQQINVIAYSKPTVIPISSENAILCYRSDGNGKRVGSSTSVWIKAGRQHFKLTTEAAKMNLCALQWRRKLITDKWNDKDHIWSDLLPKSATTDEFNAMITGVEFDVKKAYSIQIRAIDDIGGYDVKSFEIPTQDVALHLGRGGKNVSVGTYCDYSEDYTFYSDWKMKCGSSMEVESNAIIGGEMRAASIGQISDYMGLDLNELLDHTGYYTSAASPTEAIGCKNFPTDATGMLTVVGRGDFAYQTYTTYDGRMFARSYYTVSGWTAWKQIQMA